MIYYCNMRVRATAAPAPPGRACLTRFRADTNNANAAAVYRTRTRIIIMYTRTTAVNVIIRVVLYAVVGGCERARDLFVSHMYRARVGIIICMCHDEL